MASTQSLEASEIRRRGRQRLIGAVAIALLLIVFVPMVLDSDPRPARQEPDLKIPPRENPAPLPAPTPAPAEAPKVAVVQPKVVPVPAPPPMAAVTPAPTPAPKAAPAPAASAKEGFAIQVGAFADESKAQQLKEKLASSNLSAYTESAGSLTRIRVGPFTTRDAAEKTIPAVRLIVPDAKVVSLP
jgi:DedD protein